MTLTFEQSFLDSLSEIRDRKVKGRIQTAIENAEQAKLLQDIPNLKKLKGHKTYYRIRVGSYRLGLELVDGGTLNFIIAADRKDIYKHFP